MTNTPVTCPVEAAMRVLGGKWKPLILFYLMDGTKRFGELRRLMPHVTQQMLTLQLRELEQDGIIHREVYKQVPPKVEYCLTPLGRQLEPTLKQMLDWGLAYMEANGIEAVPPAELAAKAGR
ncbi:MAG: helix-turn-helix transcriptional regulator [Pleurocapsa minor GSE-CHR-MK-17-07R]|nr:helix-turn-helix transcriptional regulator [Pleurocapsa minor GSE-CHR-MK 17-07R]